MNRVNSDASRLIELYLEIELGSGDGEEPKITKTYPKHYTDGEILKILPNFAYPFKNKVEK
jgi:hypothetical protein